MARIRNALRWTGPPTPQRFFTLTLVIVNAIAMLGQVLFGVDNYTPGTWPTGWRIAVALVTALGIETVALYVAWLAHRALLARYPAAAARLRRASYALGLAVATLNFSHFAPDWRPTAAAIVFGGFSMLSPWLWGHHTRNELGIQLRSEGHADSTTAVFSPDKWWNFPWRTLGARRYSIEHGVPDARAAWTRYNAERIAKSELRAAGQATSEAPTGADHEPRAEVAKRPANIPGNIPPEATHSSAVADKPAGPLTLVSLSKPRGVKATTRTDEQCLASAARWIRDRKRVPSTNREIREAYGVGYTRAMRLHEQHSAELTLKIAAGGAP